MITDLATYLDSEIAALSKATNLFIGFLPNHPDESVALYETSGSDDLAMGGPVAVRIMAVQVATRSTTYASAETLAYAIHGKLNATNKMIGQNRYMAFSPVNRPTLIERDVQDRYVFSGNYEIRW